jgi:DNA gyrase subunit A
LAKRSRGRRELPLFDKRGLAAGAPPGGDGANGSGVIALHEAAQSRYLNYALSVITSRALPDVRDGLKPVQRRILHTMWQQGITSEARHRKCATVVGAVMGGYHPHGDAAIYDALVRMAQPFSLRLPLVDGSGNFGSLDGDGAAAMRYTECRLARAADDVLGEIGQQTVHFRPNFDGTKSEPVVLPARIPNLLVNGATGIAVGMATSIPPHNLGEVSTALLKLLDNPELKTNQLCRFIKGPDFPTGAQILASAEELRRIYREGAGTIRVRGTWQAGPPRRGGKVITITSIPYMLNKATLVERIAEVVLSRKMPLLVDVKDVSTDDVRIELELKRDADEQKVMAYLCKHTPLQTNFNVNLTCLVPTENPEVGRPERCDLRQLLLHFLQFRLEVVTRRLKHEQETLARRIHVLKGFVTVFDALDQVIKIIRASEGKADAAQKLMARFPLDAEQTDAILELRLYRLARLEILLIRQELAEKARRVREIARLLKSEAARWKIVRQEIEEIQKKYGPSQPRRTLLAGRAEEPEFTTEDFIVEEDNVVILTRDGWVKRQKEVRDLSSTRLREGDAILAVLPGSTRASLVFFTNYGTAYTCRVIDVPPSTGYGEPIQKQFRFNDGERVVAASSLDPRVTSGIEPSKPGGEPPTHGLAVSSNGYSLRFSVEPFAQPSTRAGRKFARVSSGAQVVGVALISGKEAVVAATRRARAMLCKAKEVNFLAGPGKGVLLIKLGKDDRVIGFIAAKSERDKLTVETDRGGTQTISTARYALISRGGKGREILKRGNLVAVVPEELAAPAPFEEGPEARA